MNTWTPRPLRIVERTRETADTFTLRFDVDAFPFAPGQFNMLYAFGAGEVAISISGDPARRETLIHTIRAVGSVTDVIARLEVGATLGVRGPYGHGWPLVEGSDLLIVAGGLGLAPLRPVVYDVLGRRDRFGRVTLLYGARSPEELLYATELDTWRHGIEVDVIVDHAAGAWSGPVGVVPLLIEAAAIDPARTIALVCGPEVMMRFCVRGLAARGVAAERVFVSLERNMKCAVGVCGHCQYRETFVCKDGPVVRFDRIAAIFDEREL